MAAALDTTAKREGHKAMEKSLTAAASVRRSFKAGPPRRKDLCLTPARAVVEAWALCDELQTTMRRLGLSKGDVHAALVLLTPNTTNEREDTIHVYPVPDMAGLPALYEKVMELQAGTAVSPFGANVFPLGVVFKQFDREAEHSQGPEVWVHPWLVFPNASLALSNVMQRYSGLGPGEEIFFHQAK
jgi:hypothetical protein